jgi:hypothetical protein
MEMLTRGEFSLCSEIPLPVSFTDWRGRGTEKEAYMKEYDVVGALVGRFKAYIDGMDEVVSDRESIAQKEEEKLSLKVFTCPSKESNPLEKICIMTMENVKVSPRILSDVPGLYSDELAQKLGDPQF